MDTQTGFSGFRIAGPRPDEVVHIDTNRVGWRRWTYHLYWERGYELGRVEFKTGNQALTAGIARLDQIRER